MTTTTKQLLTAQHDHHLQRAKGILDQAEREGRGLTAEENRIHQGILAEVSGLSARLGGLEQDDAMKAAFAGSKFGLMDAGGSSSDNGGRSVVRASFGQQFVTNETYRSFISAGGHRRTGAWTSPPVELSATTLDTSSGSGGPLITPDTQPGVVMLPTRRIVIPDLISPGTTDSNLVQYMKEKTFTNAAAPVAEGATKPESTLVFEASTSPVQKLAHWIPVTEEALEDFAQTQSIIDGRLRNGLSLTEEDQILNGDGVTPNLLGFQNLPGLATAVARGSDSNSDAIAKQIAAIALATNLEPDGIIMNPANWLTIQLMKLASGEYASGSSPLAAPIPRVLWGLKVAVTTAIPAGVALVGCFRSAATLFRKGPIRVESSNSHASFFISNLVAIRAEERLALAVYREGAFGKVTGLA